MQRLAGAPEPWSRCAHPAGGGGEDARDAPSLPAHIFTPEMGESSHCPSQGGNAEARSQKCLRGCMHVQLGVTDRQLETALSTTVLAPFISCCC